jgi:SAGA-associated factor 29
MATGKAFPYHKSDKYPKNIHVDFRKLDVSTLQSYIAHYNLAVRPDVGQDELAVAVARHFELEAKRPDEEETLNTFLGAYDRAFGKALGYEAPSKRSRTARGGGFGPAKEGEQVAAKDGAKWILAGVHKYYAEQDEYDVADEDDPDQRIRLQRACVVRLEDNIGSLQKGDAVLAVFPDTTSFYRGRISKPVKNRGVGGEIAVQFEDDEDETGRTPHRRVPARHVMADPDDEGDDDDDDGDAGGAAADAPF